MRARARAWYGQRTSRWRDWALEQLLESKRRAGAQISVVIPARTTSAEGGRVTELVARPLLSLWWPELAGVVQPLAGEWAARRELMESLSIPVGYGVELSTLLDTAAIHGLGALAQVDQRARERMHRADHDPALMAAELLLVAERRRSPRPSPLPRKAGEIAELQQLVRGSGQVRPVVRPVPA